MSFIFLNSIISDGFKDMTHEVKAKDITHEAKAKDYRNCPRGSSRPRTCPRGLHHCKPGLRSRCVCVCVYRLPGIVVGACLYERHHRTLSSDRLQLNSLSSSLCNLHHNYPQIIAITYREPAGGRAADEENVRSSSPIGQH